MGDLVVLDLSIRMSWDLKSSLMVFFGCSVGLSNYVLGSVGRLSRLRRCGWCSVGGVDGNVNLSCVLWVLQGYMPLCILIYVRHR